MAYLAKNLSVLQYANGFTLWHYKTTDTAATVDTSGYFNLASGMISAGDVIYVNTETGGTMKTGQMVVASNSAGVVDVADMVRLDTTNTD